MKSGGAPPHSKTQGRNVRRRSRPHLGVRQYSAAFKTLDAYPTCGLQIEKLRHDSRSLDGFIAREIEIFMEFWPEPAKQMVAMPAPLAKATRAQALKAIQQAVRRQVSEDRPATAKRD